MFTNLMYMDTAKSPKSPTNCNGSFSNNVGPPKKVYDFTNIKHQRTSIPFKNTQDDKTVRTNSSQESSQLGKEHKMILNMLKRADSDNIDVNSQDEKLILKIANKNVKHILPSDKTEINTQEFIKLNLQRAFQNLQQSCMQLNNSCKAMIESISSEDVTVVTASESSKLKDSNQNNKNEDIYEKTNNSICMIDHDQDSESLTETPNSKSLKQDEDPEIIYFRSLCTKLLKMKSKIDTISATIHNEENKSKQTYTVVKSFIDCEPSTSTTQSVNGLTHSKQYNDTFSKPSASEEYHLMHKMSNLPVIRSKCSNESPQVDDVGQNKKSKLNSNTILNKPVLNSINFLTTASEDEDCVLINQNFPKVQNAMAICTHERLFSDTKKASKRFKKVKPILTCVPSGQIHKDMVNSSRGTMKLRRKLNSNRVLNNPDLNTVNYLSTTSEDDDCVLINQGLPKVQNAVTVGTHKRLIDDSREANKRLKVVKPLFTCNPNGFIHNAMLNFIYKEKNKSNKY